MKNKSIFGIIIFLFSHSIFANFSLEKLQVNYENQPLGTDIAIPQFSWQLKAGDNKKGYLQTAYQIVVTDENNIETWNSEKVKSGISLGINYTGKTLAPRTKYTWKLTVWDNFGQKSDAISNFETGFLNPSQAAWSGAEWIGGGDEDLVFYSDYQSVFSLEYGIQLDQKTNSTKAAFLFGANDPRLMKKELNLKWIENKKNESYVSLELDISDLKNENGSAKFNIFRVGYSPEDKVTVPFKTVIIPSNIINKENQYHKHTVFGECNFGIFEFWIDKKDAEHKLKLLDVEPVSRFAPRGLNLNPVGSGNNFISFPMVAEIGFKTEKEQSALFSEVKIKNFRKPNNELFYENLNKENYKGIFKDLRIENGNYIVKPNTLSIADPSRNAVPMLRTEFLAENKTIKKARLYVTARGIYEFYINGQRISNDYFNPGLTQYNEHHMYQTYDVSNSIKTNQANALGAWLSEGWWSGNITYSGESWNYFGDRQSLLANLIITYTDGSEQIISTNDKNWKVFTDGPILCGSFFQGEVYDANKEAEINGWTMANFDAKNWKPASVIPLKGTAFIGDETDALGRKTGLSYDKMQLIGQIGNNPTQVKIMPAILVEEVRPKVFVYDMGQNMVGFPKIQIRNGKKGDIITLRYAEIKYPALPDYKGNEGMVMMENIRAALTQDLYILKGGDEIIQPRFTFHGYRYLEITGIENALPLTDVSGIVISSVLGLNSGYETNNALVNKLWQNITWSLRSNFLSIPTDTPARNERMGWSGDISVFSKSATYLTDANQFMRRHLLAMRDVQAPSGRFTDVAPMGGGFGGTLWGSAGIIVAWETYQQYGDKQLLAEHFDAMKKYVDFLESKIEKESGILNEGPLGDWLSPEGNKNDNTLFWMAYYAYDLEILSKMAEILSKPELTKELSSKSQTIKEKFNETYVDAQTHKTIKSGVKTGYMGPPNEAQGKATTDKGQLIDTQASYAIPLALGTFNQANQAFAIENLKETINRTNKDDGGIERPSNSLMTGFIGTASISQALSENGSDALAYKLLVNKQYPSWLYSVVNGATSIWERLNSYTVEDGFGGNNSMNSFNHYSFGAVAGWMYNYSLGIQRDPKTPAFKSFILKPTPDRNKDITFAKGYYDSMYGRISSEWQYVKDGWTYEVTVPANTTATLFLPAKSSTQITENGKPINTWKGLKTEKTNIQIPLVSGSYKFSIKSK
ncbi:alpha-L-rhamnosidase [Lacihabitans sp. LS3-19]|uniref:alpha-L-rhamnosidase n=1 Tax=Lacihabitans sp. LS3-19 TaxID=2487335 RepID=UPI0020CD9566|nr:alpha-L-rhamnosidase [Lacihabitans sp. LS3-19]MCP9770439.1 alpha-L-rhamnosidase [Lacihabitans sp. LS3-19]